MKALGEFRYPCHEMDPQTRNFLNPWGEQGVGHILVQPVDTYSLLMPAETGTPERLFQTLGSPWKSWNLEEAWKNLKN